MGKQMWLCHLRRTDNQCDAPAALTLAEGGAKVISMRRIFLAMVSLHKGDITLSN